MIPAAGEYILNKAGIIAGYPLDNIRFKYRNIATFSMTIEGAAPANDNFERN